jgi:hypothetical protein
VRRWGKIEKIKYKKRDKFILYMWRKNGRRGEKREKRHNTFDIYKLKGII